MSDLTDFEICKRIAEIKNLTFCTGSKYARVEIWSDNKVCGYMDFNPLKDRALCFDLMIEEGLQLLQLKNGDYIAFKQRVFVNVINSTEGVKSPQRALCLEIIRQHDTNVQL